MIKNFLDSDNEEPNSSAKPARSNVQLLGLSGEEPDNTAVIKNEPETSANSIAADLPAISFGGIADEKKPAADNLSTGETIRMSGMAYTAAISLTGSIVFMLMLGWFADLMFGSSPWGIVTGIVLGSIVGFIQFFRITSGMFGPAKPPEHTTLFSQTANEDNASEHTSGGSVIPASETIDKDRSSL